MIVADAGLSSKLRDWNSLQPQDLASLSLLPVYVALLSHLAHHLRDSPCFDICAWYRYKRGARVWRMADGVGYFMACL